MHGKYDGTRLYEKAGIKKAAVILWMLQYHWVRFREYVSLFCNSTPSLTWRTHSY